MTPQSTIDLTKPLELVRSDGKTHEAIAVQLPDDTLIRRKTAATPFYWRWTGDQLRLLDGRPQNVWTLRPLSPRPSTGGVEIGEGWILIGTNINRPWKYTNEFNPKYGLKNRDAYPPAALWGRSWDGGAWESHTTWMTLIRNLYRLATPADFTAGQPGEHIPLADIPEEQNGVRLRDEVRKLREPKPDYSRLVTPKGRECEMRSSGDYERSLGCWAKCNGRLLWVCRIENAVKLAQLTEASCPHPNAWPFPPETGARIDALLDEMEAKERPDYHNITIGGKAAMVWEWKREPTKGLHIQWVVQVGGREFDLNAAGQSMRESPVSEALVAEFWQPATRPLPESAKAKIAAMLNERTPLGETLEQRMEDLRDALQPAAPAVDWKAWAHEFRTTHDSCMTNTSPRTVIAALCEFAAKLEGGRK